MKSSLLEGRKLTVLLAVFGLLLVAPATTPTASAAQSTITLKQLNSNQIEAVVSGLKYPLAGVVHVVTDYPTCDDTAIRGSHLPELEDRLDFHELMSEQYERNTDSSYTYYQGQAGDWADKNRQFKFLFPASGSNEYRYVRDRNTHAPYPPAKYLCMKVTFHDNNQFLADYEQITLLTVSNPTVEGYDYQFTASRNAHWSVKKAGHIFDFETCEEDVAASGSASKSFTFETTEADRYKRFCVIARDSSGIQAFKLIMANPPKDEPDPPKPQNFQLKLGQTEAGNQVTVTATVTGNNSIETNQWQYLVADSDKVSIGSAADCRTLFENPPAGQILVRPRSMTKQTKKNTASAGISTNRAGHWVCIKAQEQNGGVGFGYIMLPEPEEVTTTTPTTTTTTNEDDGQEETTTAPTPEPPEQDQPEPEQQTTSPDDPPAEPPDTGIVSPNEESSDVEVPAVTPAEQPAEQPNGQTPKETGGPWLIAISVAAGVALSLTIWLVIAKRQLAKRPNKSNPQDN